MRPLFLLFALATLHPHLRGAETDVISRWLHRPIMGVGQSQEEVKSFVTSRVAVVPEFDSVEYWDHYASTLRRNVVRNVVLRGKAKTWRDTRGGVEWLETISGGPEYNIRKLRFEPVRGLWVPALLYEPTNLNGKVPVVLNVNGHDRAGKAAEYKQIRCINQAKRGMLALNVEWLGMGQLQSAGFDHYRMNQLDLCGTSGLAPFYLSLTRGLDILLEHDHADPTRVAVAGLSGGGWQTIFVSALDPRVTLANPVAGYSSFLTRAHHTKDLGDSEQTPSDLGAIADYTHLTMLLAPRPALLTYNAKDNCCFESGYALPPLVDAAMPVYELYGKAANLTTHVNHDPGDHNFGADNRQALYRKLSTVFSIDPASPFPMEEFECGSELKTAAALHVELPQPNADLHSLAVDLASQIHHTVRPESEPAHLDQANGRRRLIDRVRGRTNGTVASHQVAKEEVDQLKVTFWRLRLDDQWTVPVVEIASAPSDQATIVLADGGRRSVADRIGSLVRAGHRVFAVDPFYFGESSIKERDFLYALQVATVGERPLGIQSSQALAIANWIKRDRQIDTVSLVAFGERTSLIGMIAAAMDKQAIDEVHLHESFGSLKQVIEQDLAANQAPELFCFGLLEDFDIAQIAELIVPREVSFHGASPRVRQELIPLVDAYSRLGIAFNPIE